MGHRALYARQRGPDEYDVYHLHWGALDAEYLGKSAKMPSTDRRFKRVSFDRFVDNIDALYHEAIYVEEMPDDDGADAFVPLQCDTDSYGDGNFAIVELHESDEWSEIGGSEYHEPLESIDDPDAFVEKVAGLFGADRIPGWSPLQPERE